MLMFSTIQLAKTMLPSSADNAIMTIGEVAGYLKVTERTIYRLAGAKQIPAFKVGGSLTLPLFSILHRLLDYAALCSCCRCATSQRFSNTMGLT